MLQIQNQAFTLFVICAHAWTTIHGQSVDADTDRTPTSSSSKYNPDDDRTLLDTFGEAAKEFLTQKVIPPTDLECKWDWRTVRCEPICNCDFLPTTGDYHLGRACRQRIEGESKYCGPSTQFSNPPAHSFQWVIQRIIQGSQKIKASAGRGMDRGHQEIQTRVCDHLPDMANYCSDNDVPMLAWQERLFCRHQIPACDSESNSIRQGE